MRRAPMKARGRKLVPANNLVLNLRDCRNVRVLLRNRPTAFLASGVPDAEQ
jgi:hypothetical protein